MVVRATISHAKAGERTRDELPSRGNGRLMSVMAGDLVGYSRLMEDNEVDTMDRPNAASDVTDTISEDHDGAITGTGPATKRNPPDLEGFSKPNFSKRHN